MANLGRCRAWVKLESRLESQSETERDFYDTLFVKSKEEFQTFLLNGEVSKNYTHILLLLLRLRQACCHPLLVFARWEPLAIEQGADASRRVVQ